MARLLFMLLGLIAWREDASGASYYISPSGSDSNGCTASLPCATFPRCAAVMAAGDTCYALDGTYVTTNTGRAQKGWDFHNIVGGTVGARKRFTSASQDATKVIIRPSAPQDDNNMTIEGTVGQTLSDYFEFDHLTIQGRNIMVTGVDGTKIHHNILRCPDEGEGNSGNEAMWYVYGEAGDLMEDVHIYENVFELAEDCSDLGPLLGGDNIELLGSFYTLGMIIEKNDFVNRSTTGNLFATFLTKRGDKQAIIRNNFFKNRYGDGTAMWALNCGGDNTGNCIGNAGPPPYCQNSYHNNVFVNGNVQVDSACSTDERIYNNTIVNPDTRCLGIDATYVGWDANGKAHSVFNNICYMSGHAVGDAAISIPFYGTATWPCVVDQTYLDNNIYYPDNKKYKDCSGSVSNTLVEWKTHLAAAAPANPTVRETNSRSVDPLFVNVSAENFRLQAGSPAASGGRGVGYPSYIGAYSAAGTEQIGCSFHSSCYSYTAPSVHPRTKVR